MKMPLITSPLFSLLPIPRPPTMLMPRDFPGSRKSSTLKGRSAVYTLTGNISKPSSDSLPGLVPVAVGGALLPLSVLPLRQDGDLPAQGILGERNKP